MSKRNEGKYRIVDKLPKGAVFVKDYAAEENVRESALYNRLKRGKANFEIIVYLERNFILPHSQSAKAC